MLSKQYINENNIQNICIDINVNSYYTKIFKRELMNLLNHRIDKQNLRNCNYLVKIIDASSNMMLADPVGISMHNSMKLQIFYTIFEINKEKINNLENILENPSPVKFEDTKNSFKGIAADRAKNGIDENAENYFKAYNDAYTSDLNRIREFHKDISQGNILAIDSYQMNPNLLMSEYYSKFDSIEFMSKSLAKDTFNRIIININKIKNVK